MTYSGALGSVSNQMGSAAFLLHLEDVSSILAQANVDDLRHESSTHVPAVVRGRILRLVIRRPNLFDPSIHVTVLQLASRTN